MRYSSDEAEAAAIAAGISKIDRSQRGEVAVLARTRALLERMHKALTDAEGASSDRAAAGMIFARRNSCGSLQRFA